MTRLTTQEIEAIRERIESIWFDEAYVKGDPWKGYEVRCVDTGQTIAETSAEIDAEFIASAREDIPKLLAEVERLRGVLSHIDELSDEFFEIEVINGKLMFVICEGLEGWSDLLSEISIASYKAVNT